MLRNHKKIVIIIVIFISVIMAGWFSFSAYSKKWLEWKINVLITDLREGGSTVSYSAIDITVNPLSVQAIIQNPHLKDPQELVEWKGQEIKIFVRPWERLTLNFDFQGEQKVSILQTPALGVLRLEGAKGTLHLTSHGDSESAAFTIGRLSSFLGDQPQPLALRDLSLNLSHMNDPLNLKLSLTTQVTNLEKLFNKEPREHPLMVQLKADLSGFKSQLPFPKSLTEWRDGGGVLEVRQLNIDWPPILAEIEGTLTLDEEMYPLGSFSSRISGYREAINDMVELGWIKRKKATMALLVLDLLSSSNEKGEKQLKAPLTLQNKRFSVGPVPLLKLQPVEIK